MIFQQMELRIRVKPLFPVILTGQSISEISLIIQGHLQDQVSENIIFNKGTCVIHLFSWDLDREIYL